jgi:hypothetical protein
MACYSDSVERRSRTTASVSYRCRKCLPGPGDSRSQAPQPGRQFSNNILSDMLPTGTPG